MSFEWKKPEQVRRAQLAGDHDALSKMGRKGSKASAEKRRLNREHRQQERDLRAAMLAEDLERAQQERNENITPEGDVVPPRT